MSLYRKVLRQALSLSWNHKYLWFFGLFAALLGSGGEYEIIMRSLGGEMGQGLSLGLSSLAETNIFSGQIIETIGSYAIEDSFSFILFLLISLATLALTFFLIWLTVVSQVALVNNSAAVLSGKKHNLDGGIEAGKKNFWPVLGFNLLLKIIIFLTFVVIGLPIALTLGKLNYLASSLLYLAAFIIFVSLAVSLSFIVKYAIAYLVIKGNNFSSALKKAWFLFVDNWLISLEMAFALFFINFFFGLAIILLILILATPLLFLALIFYYLTSFVGFWLVVVFAMLLFLAIVILSGAALTAFQVSAWTGLFVELVGRGGISKIVRLADNLIKK